ncbi:two-component sensor histidine kinase [Parasulfuritortus cantonensis]|uniref:histidine kinase n=1 Tax=Parasulfuritortus cantonensis TaxID=2528202 RepID=A0A4V6NB07_9PROT|nr:ATP-binding protein [Parasulfuritortus cantonensis]TCJ15792.1 two-component sensor histidine kinase [Parasulfuritortus cantonensis]
MRTSIQARLLVPVMLAVLVVGLVTAWLAYQRAVKEVDELFDAQLSQYVGILLALAHETDDDDEVRLPNIDGHRYENRMLFQIWHREHGRDRLLIRSPGLASNWPEQVARSGYSVARIDGRTWRCFAATDDDGDQVAWAALDLDIRAHLAGEIAEDNMKPYLFGLPVLAAFLWLAIRRGLAPLRRLQGELAARSPERLDPLAATGLPRELKPLVETLNRLFGRVDLTIENERRFTNDAAHELRTPLAALRVQLQVAQRTPDDEERHSAIAKALLGAGRMSHLVTQLLALARLESSGTPGEAEPVDLRGVVADVAADLAAMARERQVTLELDADAPALALTGNPGLIRALARNLIDNALRYARPGGRVRVSVAGGTLRVADDGPGVAAEEREKLGLRFHRFGPQSAEGVGLGLSIVRRIAELHGAGLSFGAGLDGGGLTVEVAFPARPA